MEKQKKTGKSDRETLKHYEAYEDPLPPNQQGSKEQTGIEPGESKQPQIKKVFEKAFESAPKFIKAKIAVDRLMSNRKSAVIKDPARKKNA